MLKLIVSAIRTPFFQFKEYLHRRAQPGFNWSFEVADSESQVLEYAHLLSRDGIVVLPAFFSGELLQRLQGSFDRALHERAERNSVKDSISAHNFLDIDESFTHTAFDERLLEILARYFRKPFGLGRVVATRLLPTQLNPSLWHHDGRGRQLHLMILLTDVAADGKRMKYLTRSHRRYYSKMRGQGHGTRFQADMMRGDKLGDRVIEVTGPAGTVAVFDSNGLHSATHNDSPVRDVLIYSYVSWRHCWQWKSKIRRADFERLSPAQKRVVTFNPHHQLIDA